MKFLVALRSAGYARHLQSTLRGLCERGHRAVVLVPPTPGKRNSGLQRRIATELEGLAADLDGLTIRSAVEPRGASQSDLAGSLRNWLTYLRYLEPGIAEAPKLRERAGRPIPDDVRKGTEAAVASPEIRDALVALGRTVERSLPVPEPIGDVIAEERPDAVIVCPLMERGSPQTAYLRAARASGIPSAVCVASWDNLTTSSLIFGEPDLVTVWNEAQSKEASELHGIAAERVVVTGAPLYDSWFGQGPSTPREEFLRRLGLPEERPYILYVCSSGFIAPDEAAWITRWIAGVREAGEPELEGLPILVRPHPQHTLIDESAAARRLTKMPDVVIHPREGALSLAESTIADYYDSIHHAAAVVGINTSAMIETAIVGRGVHVLMSKRYRDTQDGVPHFDHLRSAGGGLIEATRKWGDHAAGLARAVRGDDQDLVAERNRRFLEAFVRPHGLDQAATPLMIDHLERLAGLGISPARPDPFDEPPHGAIATLERVFGSGLSPETQAQATASPPSEPLR